jgi:hypothetical protein
MISRLSQFHENEELVGAAQTRWGAVVLWCVAILLLAWHESSVSLLAAVTVVMLYPAAKRLVLSLAAVGILFENAVPDASPAAGLTDPSSWLLPMAKVALLLGLLYLAYLAALRFKQWPAIIRRFPLITLHAGMWLGMMLSPWLGMFGRLHFYVWRVGYLVLLASRGKADGTRFRDHLFYLVPVFGGTDTPYGKGLDFLSRREAHDSEAFARSQLAGIKLLLLAVLWTYVLDLMNVMIFGQASERLPAQLESWSLDLPRMVELLQAGGSHPWYQGWLVVYLEHVIAVLEIAVFGHWIIGSLRLVGFNVFRNTYKPLLSESVVDFFNRFDFYFKELLLDFFFYPVYLRLRSISPRLRLFLAIFAAAFVGNLYYHVLAYDSAPVIALDFAHLWETWAPRVVYSFLLALGIWVSMLREEKKRRAGDAATLPVRLRRIAGVWTFYAVIRIWGVPAPGITFYEATQVWTVPPPGVDTMGRTDFFMSLFGL